MTDETDNSRPPPVVKGGRLRRSVPMAGFAARTMGEGVVAALRSKATDGESKARFHERTAERYADLLGMSKGALMKAGQLLSFVEIDGLVPTQSMAVYRAALQRLQADAPPMPFNVTRSVVEAELGRSIRAVYTRFEPEPMAAASIGQVHRAVLADGREVAVKVQYPGVDQAIRDDLANAELLSTFLQLGSGVVRGLTSIRYREVAQELTDRISEELDYRREAANMQLFADAYRDHPFIHVPDVVPEASADRVLTMGLAAGMPFAKARLADQALRDQWGEILYRFVWDTVRRHGWFNADPHPGNYLFCEDGTVSFVDFGCVKVLTDDLVRAHEVMFRAMLDDDARRLRAAMVEAGFLDASAPPTGEEILEWYSSLFIGQKGPQPFTHTPEGAAERITRAYSPTGDVHDRVGRYLDLPPDFVMTVRIDLGLLSVLGQLRSTGYWRAISDELDGLTPPATELGRRHAEWLAQAADPT